LTDSLHDARSGDPEALTQALVRIPSVNPDLEPGGAGEGDISDFCATLLQEWGLDTEVREAAPGRPNVVARLEGDGPTLLLNGHLDTVGVASMTIDPFGGARRNGRIWGRGSCDMKGGVAALLSATHALAREGPRPNLIVALTADEENASVGMSRLVASGLTADCAVVCEPTELSVMPAHKGFVWLRVSFRGRAAHGSRPDLGIDAVRHAARYLVSLDAHGEDLLRAPAHPLLGHGSFHAGTIAGGSAASVYPESCVLVLERRTLPNEPRSDVIAPFEVALRALAGEEPGLDASIDVTLERPGSDVPRDTPFVGMLLDALRSEGCSPEVRGMSAWVDAAYLNGIGIPAVCFGPGSIEQAHTADEWIDADQIGSCASVLARFGRSLVTRGTEG
jgi:acetylornithine deacetylase